AKRELVVLSNKAEVVGYAAAGRGESRVRVGCAADEESGTALNHERHVAGNGRVTVHPDFLRTEFRIGTNAMHRSAIYRDTKGIHRVGAYQVSTSHGKRLRQIIASGFIYGREDVLRNAVWALHVVQRCHVSAEDRVLARYLIVNFADHL